MPVKYSPLAVYDNYYLNFWTGPVFIWWWCHQIFYFLALHYSLAWLSDRKMSGMVVVVLVVVLLLLVGIAGVGGGGGGDCVVVRNSR